MATQTDLLKTTFHNQDSNTESKICTITILSLTVVVDQEKIIDQAHFKIKRPN